MAKIQKKVCIANRTGFFFVLNTKLKGFQTKLKGFQTKFKAIRLVFICKIHALWFRAVAVLLQEFQMTQGRLHDVP